MMLKGLRSGISTIGRNKKMIFVYYFFNLVFGLLVAIPFYAVVSNLAGNTLIGEKLGGRMDIDFFFEFLIKSSNAMDALKGIALVIPVLYGVWGIFLSGGAYACLVRSEHYTAQVFWGNAAKFFWRFFRLFLLSIPVFVILFCLQFVETGIVRLLYGKDPYESVIYWGAWIRVGFGYIGILLYFLILDYARIYTVAMDEWRMWKALWFGIRFSFRHFFTTFGLSLVIFILGIILLFIYNPVADLMHNPGALILLALFIVQQLYMLVRMMLKLTLYSSQVRIFESILPDITEEHVIPPLVSP